MSSIQGVFWDVTACVFVFLLHLTTRVPQCPHRQAWLVSVSYFFYFERIGWICGCVGVELTQLATCGLARWHQLGTKPLNTKPCSWGLSLSTRVRDLEGSMIRSIQNLWQKAKCPGKFGGQNASQGPAWVSPTLVKTMPGWSSSETKQNQGWFSHMWKILAQLDGSGNHPAHTLHHQHNCGQGVHHYHLHHHKAQTISWKCKT